MVGFISGVAFGALLSFAERRKTILDLSPGRAAVWGILASAAFPLLTGRADAVLVLCFWARPVQRLRWRSRGDPSFAVRSGRSC